MEVMTRGWQAGPCHEERRALVQDVAAMTGAQPCTILRVPPSTSLRPPGPPSTTLQDLFSLSAPRRPPSIATAEGMVKNRLPHGTLACLKHETVYGLIDCCKRNKDQVEFLLKQRMAAGISPPVPPSTHNDRQRELVPLYHPPHTMTTLTNPYRYQHRNTYSDRISGVPFIPDVGYRD